MKQVSKSPKYSVLMSAYIKDNPCWLKEAVDSMLAQTIPPSEFVIVKDGLVGEALDRVIASYEREWPELFKIVQLPVNMGSGAAKKIGIESCVYEFVAILDSDDISLPNRIEKGFEQFGRSPELDVVGSLVAEFIGSIDNVVAHVLLPERHEDIVKFAKKRCPVRHTALLFRKEALIQAGNYGNIRFGEEYELVVRMIQAGKKFYNIPEILCYMRVNDDFYRRRGGVQILKKVYVLKKSFLKSGFLSRIEFIYSFLPHAIVMLMPGRLRVFVYNRFLRK